MGGPRLSMAGLMILVGFSALDCAILAHIINLWDQSVGMTVCLLIDVMPFIIGAEIAILFALRPPARRRQASNKVLEHLIAIGRNPRPG
jgi:hypothetical protein